MGIKIKYKGVIKNKTKSDSMNGYGYGIWS